MGSLMELLQTCFDMFRMLKQGCIIRRLILYLTKENLRYDFYTIVN